MSVQGDAGYPGGIRQRREQAIAALWPHSGVPLRVGVNGVVSIMISAVEFISKHLTCFRRALYQGC